MSGVPAGIGPGGRTSVTVSGASALRGSVRDGSVTAWMRKTFAVVSRNECIQCSEYQTRLVPTAIWVTPSPGGLSVGSGRRITAMFEYIRVALVSVICAAVAPVRQVGLSVVPVWSIHDACIAWPMNRSPAPGSNATPPPSPLERICRQTLSPTRIWVALSWTPASTTPGLAGWDATNPTSVTASPAARERNESRSPSATDRHTPPSQHTTTCPAAAPPGRTQRTRCTSGCTSAPTQVASIGFPPT